MTSDEFRSLALSFPETIESSHMDHPDFRVGGKIFATLGPDLDWGMAKLNAEQQAWFLTNEPDTFKPAAGAWGVGGATIITLATGRGIIGKTCSQRGLAKHRAEKVDQIARRKRISDLLEKANDPNLENVSLSCSRNFVLIVQRHAGRQFA
ncbi:MAG TPA: MmcQ/YjbR family DNA-binding protein [Pyrinomonadaceae bacterium]|nr:MmcQ/YjbR family DNA-binding protein [Pyrinomonadaceae bacterium]